MKMNALIAVLGVLVSSVALAAPVAPFCTIQFARESNKPPEVVKWFLASPTRPDTLQGSVGIIRSWFDPAESITGSISFVADSSSTRVDFTFNQSQKLQEVIPFDYSFSSLTGMNILHCE